MEFLDFTLVAQWALLAYLASAMFLVAHTVAVIIQKRSETVDSNSLKRSILPIAFAIPISGSIISLLMGTVLFFALVVVKATDSSAAALPYLVG